MHSCMLNLQQSSKLHNLVKAHNNMKVTVSRRGEGKLKLVHLNKKNYGAI